MRFTTTMIAAGVSLLAIGSASASSTTITDVNGSATTAVTAAVGEQANVSLPATATFTVTDVAGPTTTTVPVSITDIVLNDGNSLRLSAEAAASSFSYPSGGSHSWLASAISWPSTDTWTNGTEASGSLSSSAYTPVVLSSANPGTLGTSALTLTLASDTAVDRAGNHALTVNWLLESVSP